MFRCVVAKTPTSIAASKVKGHAQQNHIEAGLSTPEQKQGNDNADATADTGMKLFEPEHTVTLAYFSIIGTSSTWQMSQASKALLQT